MSQSTRFDAARCGSRPVLQFLLLIGLLCGARSSAAQRDEVVAGASGNAVLRGPWLTSPWRKPLPRLAVFTLGSFTYEQFVDHSGWNWSDFNQRLASYLVTEAVVGGVTWLRTRLARRHTPLPTLAARLRDPCMGDYLRAQTPAVPALADTSRWRCEPMRRR